MFPLMPPEVFDEWLVPIIAHQGWPFTSIYESIYTENWSGLFVDVSLAEWASFAWKKDLIQKGDLRLHPESVKLIMDIVMQFKKLNAPLTRTPITGSRERVDSALSFLVSNSSIPGFLTGHSTGNGIRLVDGHHRMAACWIANASLTMDIPCWIAPVR